MNNLKKIQEAILIILCFLIMTSCSAKKTYRFSSGNLKYSKDYNTSIMLDYQKNDIQIYEVYADKYVLSFIADFTDVDGFLGTVLIVDKAGNPKYFNAGVLDDCLLHITVPNYQLSDKIINIGKNETCKEITIEFNDFFSGITAKDEVYYSCVSRYLHEDQLYEVTDVVKTFGFYIVYFNRELSDPSGLDLIVYDSGLKNRSSHFIDDYVLYITDFMDAHGAINLKIEGNPNIFSITLS